MRTDFLQRSSPLSTNSGTHLYPESTTLVRKIKATEIYIEWSIALINSRWYIASVTPGNLLITQVCFTVNVVDVR